MKGGRGRGGLGVCVCGGHGGCVESVEKRVGERG